MGVIAGLSGPAGNHNVLMRLARADGSLVWSSDSPEASVFAVAAHGQRAYWGQSAGDKGIGAVGVSDGSELWRFTDTKDSPRGLAIPDDGSALYAATAGGTGEFGEALRLDPATGALVWRYTDFSGFDDASAIAVQPDGQAVFVGGEGDNGLHRVTSDGAQVWVVGGIGRVLGVAADGTWVYTGGSSQQIEQRDASDGALTGWTYTAPGNWISGVALSPDLATVYATDRDGVVHAIDVATGTASWTASLGGGNDQGVAVSADGAVVYAATGFARIFALAAADGSVLWENDTDGTSTPHALAAVGTLALPLRRRQRGDSLHTSQPRRRQVGSVQGSLRRRGHR